MPEITRRRALGALAGAAAALTVAGTAAAAVRPEPAATAPSAFDEVYQGRRIHGAPSHGGGHHGGGHGSGYAVRIDGEELHVMQNADDTWISVVNHYEPLATPRAVARAAVLELQGAELVPLAVA
ncbi:tyrosinase cofactor [Streptomyces sp. NBC_01210]|uniref:apotyrosinase chaperone MelC1 n=1 Tax=Streptomyces sp. NBC_01210 TaxID=2903774 RepID=UPI002E13A798|nr:tyrosinase cofactor [Streptomyces sp. NBC_01210]